MHLGLDGLGELFELPGRVRLAVLLLRLFLYERGMSRLTLHSTL